MTVFRYIIKKVATNMNSKEIIDFYEKQQRKLKKIKRGRAYEKRTDVRTYFMSKLWKICIQAEIFQ